MLLPLIHCKCWQEILYNIFDFIYLCSLCWDSSLLHMIYPLPSYLLFLFSTMSVSMLNLADIDAVVDVVAIVVVRRKWLSEYILFRMHILNGYNDSKRNQKKKRKKTRIFLAVVFCFRVGFMFDVWNIHFSLPFISVNCVWFRLIFRLRFQLLFFITSL